MSHISMVYMVSGTLMITLISLSVLINYFDTTLKVLSYSTCASHLYPEHKFLCRRQSIQDQIRVCLVQYTR